MVMGMESSYTEENNGYVKTQLAKELGMDYERPVCKLLED